MGNEKEDYITLTDLANELAMDKSHLGKLVRDKFELESKKVPPPGGRGNLHSALSQGDAEIIRQYREALGHAPGHPVGGPVEGAPPVPSRSPQTVGVLYVIELDREARPGRVKLGFTKDVEERLEAHRCGAPEATLIKSWPARRRWEITWMDAVAGDSPKPREGGEVFDVDSVDKLVAKSDSFMELMPPLDI